jgi:hypothetical protein
VSKLGHQQVPTPVADYDAANKLYVDANGVTLDGAYDFGGAGAGRTITADAGAVVINNTADNTTNGLEINKAPASARAGNGIEIYMDANCIGRTIYAYTDYTNPASNVEAMRIIGSMTRTDAPSALVVNTIVADMSVSSSHTENMTATPYAFSGFRSEFNGGVGAAGTITGVAHFAVTDASPGGATITDQYGYYSPALTGAANNYVAHLGADTDAQAIIGRARIDARGSDIAYFSHYAQSGSSAYALRQSAAGQTKLNAPNTTNITFSLSNSDHFRIDTTNGLYANNANGPAMLNEASSSTNPTLIPDRVDLTTGIGATSGTPALNLIVAGSNLLEIDSSAATFASSRLEGSPANTVLLGASNAAFKAGFLTNDSVGTSINDDPYGALGLRIANGTNATAGNQKYSPALIFEAQGWETAVGSSMEVQAGIQVQSVQGVAAPTGDLTFHWDINGVGFSKVWTIDSTGASYANNANGPAMLNEASSSTNPTLIPDRVDLTTGIGGTSATPSVSIIVGGSSYFLSGASANQFNQALNALNANGARLTTGASTGTTPNIIPRRSSLTTGIGAAGADQLSLIVSGAEHTRIDSTGTVYYGSTSGSITHAVPATITTYTLTWPSAVAAGANYALVDTDGAGTLGWTAISSFGVTLDGAYDFGGAGAGRSIVVDSGAIVMTDSAADNNNVLEINKTPVGAQSGYGVAVTQTAVATGAAYYAVKPDIAAMSDDVVGLYLYNSTTAITQASPAIRMHCFGDDGAAGTQAYEWGIQASAFYQAELPSAQYGRLSFYSNVADAAWTERAAILSTGTLLVSDGDENTPGLSFLSSGDATTHPNSGFFYDDFTTEIRITLGGGERHAFQQGGITSLSDTDGTYVFGRTLIDSRTTDEATWSHFDMDAVSEFGIKHQADGDLFLNIGASNRYMYFQGQATNLFRLEAHTVNGFYAENSAGPAMRNLASTATVPGLVPNRATLTSGIGGTGGSVTTIVGNQTVITATAAGLITMTPTAANSGTPTDLLFTRAAHTTLTASTESIGINLDMSAEKQFDTGAIATQREIYIQAPTYSMSGGAASIAVAATLAISGAPIAGTDTTISLPLALYVEDDTALFGGNVVVLETAKSGVSTSPTLQVTQGAHTDVPTSSEVIAVFVGNAPTVNFDNGGGTSSAQRTVWIDAPTYTADAAFTITAAAALYVERAPVASTNVTITNPYAVWVDAGVSRLDDGVLMVERAAAPLTVASTYGALWVKNLTPSALFYTDDTAVDFDLITRAHGEIYVYAYASTQTTNATPGNFDIITAFNTASGYNGSSYLNTNAKASNKITCGKTGKYMASFSCSFGGTPAATFTCMVYVNGVAQNNVRFSRKLGAGGDTGRAACNGIVSVTSGQDVDVRVASDGASDSFNLKSCNLNLTYIGVQ